MKAVKTATARATASMRACQPAVVARSNVVLHPRPAAVGLPPRATLRSLGRSQLQKQSAVLARSFHSSRPTGAPKSPFQAFVDTLKEEYAKSQEFNESYKQLQGEAGKVQDSETMRKMKEAYERARIITSIKENPRLQKAAEQLRKNGGHVGDAVGAALRQMEDNELIKGLGAISSRLSRQLAESTAPIRETEAYKSLSETLTEAFDDGGSALRIDTGAADAREARRLRREARLRKIGRPPPSHDPEAPPKKAAEDVADATAPPSDPIAAAAAAGAAAGAEQAQTAASEEAGDEKPAAAASSSTADAARPSLPRKPAGYAVRVRAVAENPEAGQSLVLRPESAYKQAWSRFKEDNSMFRKFSEWRMAYDESENPMVERIRGVTETIGGWFEENETAQVVGAFRALDPQFTLEAYQRDLREYVLPELIDAYHGAASHLLRQWCSEATYNVLMATVDPYVSKGMLAHGRLLDMRNVEIAQGKMLENNIPVVVVSFQTTELMYFKDAKTGEVKVGRDDQADRCRYAVVLTRVEEELDNEVTGGWKVVELARRAEGAWM